MASGSILLKPVVAPVRHGQQDGPHEAFQNLVDVELTVLADADVEPVDKDAAVDDHGPGHHLRAFWTRQVLKWRKSPCFARDMNNEPFAFFLKLVVILMYYVP